LSVSTDNVCFIGLEPYLGIFFNEGGRNSVIQLRWNLKFLIQPRFNPV